MSDFWMAAVSAAERGEWWPQSWFGRFWVLFGLCAQFAFTARFLVQWIASERRGKSHIPVSFWYLSLVGASMLLVYAAFWKRDLVLFLGQTVGGFVYVRNLMLLRREKTDLQQAGVTADADA